MDKEQTATTIIYRDMDRSALDAAYNNSKAVSDSAARVAKWAETSAVIRSGEGVSRDLRYGTATRNDIDYFSSGTPGAPLFIFIHGGYWQRNNKETFSFVAEGPRAHGIDVAVIGYTLAPDARLRDMVREIDEGIDYLFDAANTLGFDRERMFVGGWSAGGHLAAMAAHNPRIKGVLSISGIFDLEPIGLCYINEKVQLDEKEITTLSPISRIAASDIPYQVIVGGAELPELRRQSMEYSEALKAHGKRVWSALPEGLNHFTVLDEMARPDGILAQALREMVFFEK